MEKYGIATQRRRRVMAQNTVVIRKYPNRRLYNTASGKYVNLEDVAGMIRAGGGRPHR